MIQLGIKYLTGVGISRNFVLAKAEFNQAAQRPRIDAQCLFNIVSGKEVRQEQTSGQCLDAATQGSAISQLAVSYMYRNARFGLTRDLKQMVYWERMAAEQGMVDAQYSLGRDYETGYGTNKDQKLADVWYKKAAEQGNIEAMGALSTQAWEAHNPLFTQFEFEDPLNDPVLEKNIKICLSSTRVAL